jgi:radical SAM superfamily enzyme YgiQ (UPF0313 family)
MLGRRILLLNPPLVNGVAFTRQGRCQEREEVLGTTKPPYSLALLAALLRDRGHDIRLVDLTAERASVEALAARLSREGFSPSLVVFSSTTPTFDADVREVAKLKSAFGAPIVGFGPQASAVPRESMERAPALDALVVGEPEDGVLALADLASLDAADGVPGLTFRRNGQIVPHGSRSEFAGFRTMPYPAWDLLPLNRYTLPLQNRRYLIVETSRGCPYSCDFCIAPVHQGHNFRERDAKSLVDEIEEGKRRFGIDHFYLWGDTVTLNVKAFSLFCDELIARNLNVRWFGNGRADNLTNPEFVKRLRQSGCWMLSLGIESESDEVRRDMLKKLERQKIMTAIGNLREAGIESFAFFIFGYPGDTAQAIERTAAYARELDPDFANFYPAVPYPGTVMYDRCKRDGLLASDDWSKMEYSYYVLRGNGLDEAVVMNAIRSATRRFYLRPAWMARHWLDILRLFKSSGPLVMRAVSRLFESRKPAGDATFRPQADAPVPPPAGGRRLPVITPQETDEPPRQG